MDPVTPSLTPRLLSALRGSLRGPVSLRGEPRYETSRRLWSAAIDRYPAAIVHCSDPEDVGVALRHAYDAGCRVTVKGGGHNVAGRALADGALLLDLSGLNAVSVNPQTRSAAVQGGALWRDVDAATSRHDLATVGGLVSSTGVGGFTLGGGAGWLMRQHGLACDNLIGATVALPDGRFQHVSATEHADLFWGLRGGGGIAIATSLEFRLHPQRNVLAGIVVHPAEQAASVLRQFRDFAADAPDAFCGLAALVNAPPLPFLAPEWHGRPVVILALCWSGDPQLGATRLRPLQAFGTPLVTHVALMPYVMWQQSQDPSAPAGRHHYWKTANFGELSNAALDELASMALSLPTPCTEIHVQHMGGAVARQVAGETAFAHRGATFFVNLIGTAATAAEFPSLRESIRAFHDRLAPTALPTFMPNFSNEEDQSPAKLFDAARAARLQALRHRYDPAGLIGPAPG